MKTMLVIILMFIVWFVSTQFGISWPRVGDIPPDIKEMPFGPLPNVLPTPEEPDLSLEAIELQLFEKLNEIRSEQNREPLKISSHLTQKAKEHSLWMADTGKFMHSTYNYYENVWWGVGITPSRLADRIVQSWVESKPHKANLLEVGISKCGIGISYDENTRSHFATFMAY